MSKLLCAISCVLLLLAGFLVTFHQSVSQVEIQRAAFVCGEGSMIGKIESYADGRVIVYCLTGDVYRLDDGAFNVKNHSKEQKQGEGV